MAKVKRKIGQYYQETSIGTKFTYILSRIEEQNTVALISVDTGNRWSRGIQVKDLHNITPAEFRRICVAHPFKKVEVSIKVKN